VWQGWPAPIFSKSFESKVIHSGQTGKFENRTNITLTSDSLKRWACRLLGLDLQDRGVPCEEMVSSNRLATSTYHETARRHSGQHSRPCQEGLGGSKQSNILLCISLDQRVTVTSCSFSHRSRYSRIERAEFRVNPRTRRIHRYLQLGLLSFL
jgi:hypothetical protein